MSLAVAVKRKPGRPKKTEPDFATVKRAGKSRAKEPAGDEQPAKPEAIKAVNVAELLKGVVVVEERDVPFKDIQRSAHNPRMAFDEELIAEMAPTIGTVCELSPLTVREGTYELIDGETRHRAGEVGKAKALKCKIVRCTDAQAAVLRLLSSLQRRDLNAIERARGIKSLQELHGLSQRQLKEMLGLEQGTISNLTRLLDLPEDWQQRVISGEISAKAARELCPYADEPLVLKTVVEELEEYDPEEYNQVLGQVISRTGRYLSRPLKDPHYYTPGANSNRTRHVDLKPTPEQRELLRIKTIKYHSQSEERCFNVDLWEELQKAAEDAAAEKAAKKAAKKKSKSNATAAENVDPQKEVENAERQELILGKKVYRYRVSWYQDRLVESIEKASQATLMSYCCWLACRGEHARGDWLDALLRPGYHQRDYGMDADKKNVARLLALNDAALWELARSFVRDSFNQPFDNSSPAITPWMIQQFSIVAGTDLKRDWPKTAKVVEEKKPDYLTGYLDLLNKDQLIDQISEWGLSVEFSGSTKRSQLIELVAEEARGRPAPKALISAQQVVLN